MDQCEATRTVEHALSGDTQRTEPKIQETFGKCYPLGKKTIGRKQGRVNDLEGERHDLHLKILKDN